MFENRKDAADKLAVALAALAPAGPVVLALPRGGVPLGAVVAERLAAPLDLLMVRKIGMPGQPELAAGAIVDGENPVVLFNDEILEAHGLSAADFAAPIERLRAEIEARRSRYLPERKRVPIAGRTAILVDDGIATGATIRVAIRALRARAPAAIWVAVPVAPPEIIPLLQEEADRAICLETPHPFWSVGAHYREFRQVPDAEVIGLMNPGRDCAGT